MITTTNERAVAQQVGPSGVLEILGKPYDLRRVRCAVERALSREESPPSSREKRLGLDRRGGERRLTDRRR